MADESACPVERALVVPGYRVLQRVHQGILSEVYRAARTSTGERVIIKILRDLAGSEQARRMVREARVLGALTHPNIVAVIDSGMSDERPYLVMPDEGGVTLTEILTRGGTETPEAAVGLARQLLAGLQHLHDSGLVHRDIKPDNLLVTGGAERRLEICDLGVVKVAPSQEEVWQLPSEREDPGGLGTPRYFSPEQAAGLASDHRSDLYAAALVTYRLLAGRGPFDHHRATEAILRAHRQETPSPPSRWSPFCISPALDTAVLRGLAKDRAQRFSSASEMAAVLDGAVIR